MAAELQNQDVFDKALYYLSECRQHHDDFVLKVEQRYKTYRGILEMTSEAAQWTSKAHPPYVQHIVETAIAGMIEPKLRFQVRANPTMSYLTDPSAASRARENARAHQLLFDWQIRMDEFNWIQRPFILQNAIAGMTVAKTFWTKREEKRRRLVMEEEEIAPGLKIPRMVEKTGYEVVYDGPSTEVRDVRDFIFPGNAVSLSQAPYVIDRVWKLPEEIWEGFKDGGPYGTKRGGWPLERVKELIAEGKEKYAEVASRESELWNVEREKGLVEVLEVWNRVDKTVTTIANERALLSHRTSFPFFHDDYPFTVVSTHPDLFRIPGISQVEKIEHLQTLMWDVQNQSMDNLRLVNNAIVMFRPDIDDPDAYEFYPGARWLVEDPAQVQMWTPNTVPADVSLGREALIKGDMQNLAGGMPFSSGADSQFVDQKTATGASLVSAIAQRGLDLNRQQLYRGWEHVGYQRMILNQQFVREPQVVSVLGLDGEEETFEIWPDFLTGDFSMRVEPVSDSLMKQEEMASAAQLLQMALQAFPVVSLAAQTGGAKPLNLDAFMEDLLRAHEKEDFDRYFTSAPPMGGAPGAPMGAPGMAGPPGAAPPVGVTGPNSIAPEVSPSSQLSLSPIAALQRAQALDRS